MIYEMNLHPGPFESIRSGRKDIEMRLYDDRRKSIRIGDEIVFTNNETRETIKVLVVNLYRFNNFEELYSQFDKTRLGYSKDDIADSKDMEFYYSIDKIKQYGVLAIEIKLIK